MRIRLTAALLVTLWGPSLAWGQFGEEPPSPELRLDKQLTQRWQVGMTVTAQGGPCVGLYGTVSVPMDWPEQQVKVADEDVSKNARVQYRMLEDGVRQMVISVPRLEAGEAAAALVTLEITRSSIRPPLDTSGYVLPKNPPRDVRRYLAASPLIECRHNEIRSLAQELTAGKEGAWDQVQCLYDWVRDNVQHRAGKVQGAVEARRKKSGNHEDLTSLFIALCRAQKIPARTVWIPDFCYAEFYLEDAAGKGEWFPCQVAGTREFGGISDHRPILQKGDNVEVPEKKEPQRFVAEYLKGKAGRGMGKPQVVFVRKLLPTAK